VAHIKVLQPRFIVRAPSLLLAACLLLLCQDTAACRLRASTGQWIPYIYPGPDGTPIGLDVELVRAILTEAGCELLLLEELPALRRDVQFREGKLDLLMAASDLPERHEFARLTAPYRMETVRFHTLRPNLGKYRNVDFDAIVRDRLTLLAPNSGWYGPAYAQHKDGLRAQGLLTTFNTFSQGIKMLSAGRAELIIGDANAMRFEAKQAKLDLVALPLLLVNAPVRLMLSRASTSEADLARIDAAIARLEQRGTLKAIRNRYGEQ
jgi:polar amino acid transport system substrate-binding protein